MLEQTDVAEAYGLGGKPFWLVVVLLVVIVAARSHGTYWLARGVAHGASGLGARRASHRPSRLAAARERLLSWSAGPSGRRATEALRRVGPFAVTLAYLTVGAQTAVFAAAGLARMSYPRFVLASVPGCIAWAFVWATVGLGALWGAVALAARSPWLLAVVAVALTALAVAARRRSARRRAAARTHPGAGPGDAAPTPVTADDVR
ncbi:DedA family protein [Cellulomonas sp. NS3]|uniref:DedA family protein n=1 Tax=Cellulomonas sp. NS3 TaxID=2973977 RepID=UPI0021618030|nr:VTT domain-containing protein [Cellulomonas sp. NS3]